jgi:hypothetical protein
MRLFALALIGLSTAFAQSGPVDLKGSFGWTGFVDESSQDHFLAGGSVRYYITRKLSIEPEIQYLHQNDIHHDWVFLPSVAYDFRTGRVAPYVTVGLGVIRTSQEFSGRGFSSTEAFLSGGVGTKFYLNDRWFVAPEFRIGGAELHARFSVGVGYTWRR